MSFATHWHEQSWPLAINASEPIRQKNANMKPTKFFRYALTTIRVNDMRAINNNKVFMIFIMYPLPHIVQLFR